jgi:phosphomannomutase
MDFAFNKFFYGFCLNNDVYIVTGSDQSKTVEQVGNIIYSGTKRVYNCSGNDVYESFENVYTNKWTLPDEPWKYLENRLNHSGFPQRAGLHFDERPGMLNFSIVGRKCTAQQRKDYVLYDTYHKEREDIPNEFNTAFSDKYDIMSTVAGETGLDITQKNCGKAQILKDFTDYKEIIFFGDKCMAGGNDHDIAQALIGMGHTVFSVGSWHDTYRILAEIHGPNPRG